MAQRPGPLAAFLRMQDEAGEQLAAAAEAGWLESEFRGKAAGEESDGRGAPGAGGDRPPQTP